MSKTQRSLLETVFLAASELPIGEQENFLARECAATPELLPVIREMLTAERLTRIDAAWSGPAWNSAHMRFGSYRVIGCLGSGGMCVVYSAVRDDDEFRQRVAIKTIPCGLLTEFGVRRLRLERQILADLNHPNIVRLLDGGITEEGFPYVVMEYIDGQPITTYANSRELKTHDRLRLMLQVFSAIQFAHSNMVVHRDLKPANILVTEDGTPKLLDFGIAKVLDKLAEHTTTLALMTPAYASPEQIRGTPVTTTSDVYSLGVLLYELLTRGLPYRNTNTPGELADAICHQQPEFPREPARQIHSDLKNIVLMAMRKEPEGRYSSVEQFSEDIRRHLEGFPVRASKGTFRYRASKFIRRNWLAVAAAAIIAVLLVASIVVTTAQRNRADQQRLRAEAGEAGNRRLLYAAQMNLAYQAWETPNPGRALDLLEAQRPKPGQEDLRGFDWYLLWNLDRGRSRILAGPAENIYSVTFFANTMRLAASASQKAYVWEATKGTLLHSFETNGQALFTPGGRFFAASDALGSVNLWAADSGQLVRAFKGGKGAKQPLAFSPDGELLATTSGERSVKLWEAKSGRPLTILNGHQDSIISASFSPDARLVTTTSRDHTVRLWDVSSGKEAATLRGHSWWVLCASFSPSGALLATAGSDGDVKLWDISSRHEIGTIHGRGTTVQAVQFSPDGKTLAVGGLDNLIKIYDVVSRRLLDTLRGHTDTVSSLAFSPDGKTLASSASDRTVRLWDLTMEPGPVTLTGHNDWVWDVKFSPDGRTLATASKDATVKLWNVSDGREIMTLQHPQWVNGLAFSPDGAGLATADDDMIVRVWDSSAGRNISTLGSHTAVVECVAFSPDSKTLASGSKNGEITLWDNHTRKRIATMLSPNRNIIWSLEFSPDGEYLVAAEGGMPDLNMTGHVVTIWCPATQRIVATLYGHTRDVRTATFSPDGHTLASGSYDGTIKFWDPKAHREIATLNAGHKVDALAFSADGKRLASAGSDKTIKLWDVATRQELCALKVPSQVNAVAFSPNNRVLAAASNDGKVRLWLAASSDEARRQ